MRKTRVLAMVTATTVAAALSTAAAMSTADATASTPKPANRVLIVLFDQALPQYADQFHMPNFPKIRDRGTYYNTAHLSYTASKPVIAHNVITSGLWPKNLGYTDEAYQDAGNVFGKGARGAGASDTNWYYAPPALGVCDAGSTASAPDKVDPSRHFARLNVEANVKFSYQSTAIESWLIDQSVSTKEQGAVNMLKMPA